MIQSCVLPSDRKPEQPVHRTGPQKLNVLAALCHVGQCCVFPKLPLRPQARQNNVVASQATQHSDGNGSYPSLVRHVYEICSVPALGLRFWASLKPYLCLECPFVTSRQSGGLPSPVTVSKGTGAVTGAVTSRSNLSKSSLIFACEAGVPSNWSDITLAHFMARAIQSVCSLPLLRDTGPRPAGSS